MSRFAAMFNVWVRSDSRDQYVSRGKGSTRHRFVDRFGWACCVVWVVLLAGCDGCRKAEPTSPDEPIPASEFTTGSPMPYPADRMLTGRAIKPGHWFTASQSIKANVGDRRGTLRSFVNRPVLDNEGLVTGRSLLSPMESSRPVVLPKGQRRQFEYRLLSPPNVGSGQSRLMLQSRLELSGQAGSLAGNSQPFDVLAPHEYFFLALTDRPDRFARLKVSDWIRPISSGIGFQQVQSNYRFVAPSIEGLVPVPETMLDWTSTAVLFWDNLPAEKLTPGQFNAITDWLHFGGRMIVNGASASESLNRSQLASFLPIRPTGSLELPQDAAAELLRGWSVQSDTTVEKQIAMIGDGTARIMMEGRPDPQSSVLPRSGDLIASRRVGRGQVIQSRFDLSSDWFTSWASHDSFWNNTLLGRPPRRMTQDETSLGNDLLRQPFVGEAAREPLATINTSFRLFSRDATLRPPAPPSETMAEAERFSGRVDVAQSSRAERRAFRPHASGDLGGWSDDSDLVVSASERLRENAGIEIPDLGLVAKSLAAYLILLVPVNFLVFRLLGRVEYAWFAIPILAVAGAIAVARVAQLDIGFARSQTELCVLELQPNYRRGHLSRLVAVYNSLTTAYTASFANADGVAVPVGLFARGEGFSPAVFESAAGDGPSLSGFSVDSNRIGLLRSEQIVDVNGSFEWTDDNDAIASLRNGTDQDMENVYVMRRTQSDQIDVALFSTIEAGRTLKVEFDEAVDAADFADSVLSKRDDADEFGLQRAVLNGWYLQRGEVRLVGLIGNVLPGFVLAPAAGQTSGQTIVVATLVHPAILKPASDANLITDFRRVQTDLSTDAVDELEEMEQ